MSRSLNPLFFPPKISTQIVQKWVFLSPLVCTFSLSSFQNQINSVREYHNIINPNLPINEISLMKFVETSISSPNFSVSSHIFTQFQGFIDAGICSTMIRSFSNSKKHFESIIVYTQMQKMGFPIDSSTYPALLKSVAQLCLWKLGKSLHGCIIRRGFQSDVFANTSLVHMYGNIKNMISARQVFDEMPNRNSVSWNALITGYTHNRKFREAISVFRLMQLANMEPSEVTMVGVLSACAHLGALSQGKWIHNYINQNDMRLNVFMGTALIDMYAKCGVVDEAEKVFGTMRVKNVYTWNVLISGLALNGYGEAALKMVSEMVAQNFKPDGVTFLAVLCACCHQGLVEEGRNFFHSMEKEYGLRPKIEHYGSMVDLLSRAGFLDEAQELIKSMTMKPDAIIWRALLGGCRIHGYTHLGEVAISNLLELEPNNGENYVLLSNLYARDQRWTEVGEVREKMKRKKIVKVPGCSLIEVDNVVYEFVVSDSLELEHEEIYEMLVDMNKKLKLAGYVVETDLVSYDVEEEEKERSLMYHSEKLALAFGLLRTPSDSTIRIVKNLRVCKDCHSFFKFVSKVYKRDITVRDRNRFHHFVDGVCSCKDYW